MVKAEKLSRKQVENMRWLVTNGHEREIIDTVLAVKYERESDLRPKALRIVAWKRTSVRTMGHLFALGLLRRNSRTFSKGNFHTFYDVTEAGFEAAGEVR